MLHPSGRATTLGAWQRPLAVGGVLVQAEELHLVPEDWGRLCHWLWESQRYIALGVSEVRRPARYGGLVRQCASRHAPTGPQWPPRNTDVAALGAHGGRRADSRACVSARHHGAGHLPILCSPPANGVTCTLGLPALVDAACAIVAALAGGRGTVHIGIVVCMAAVSPGYRSFAGGPSCPVGGG